MALTYWEVNFAGDLYNTNTSGKVGINNPNPLLEMDVVGSVGLTSILEFKKSGQDKIQLKSASAFGYDFAVYNDTKGIYRLFIDADGKMAIGTNSATGKLTVVEVTPGNAWTAASFTNTSSVGFGIEVTGGSEGNSTAVFKNYANVIGATLSGRGELFVRSWLLSNAGTSVNGNHHFRMENNHLRFSSLLKDLETGVDNVGSNYDWRRYADNGSELGVILNVNRGTGAISWYGNSTFNGDVTITGTLRSAHVDIPLWKLSDVSDAAIPADLEGGILRAIGGEYVLVDPDTLPKQDLSSYATQAWSNARFTTLTSFASHVNNHSNPHQVSLQEVLSVNNATSIEIISSNRIVAGSVLVGDTSLIDDGTKLSINNNLYVGGQLTFDSVLMYLTQLEDVGDSVSTAPEGSILKKVSGLWVGVEDKWDAGPDLSDYYNKQDSNDRFVNITGDSMRGGLSITTADTNLTLVSPSTTPVLIVRNSTLGADVLSITNNASGIVTSVRDIDSFVISKPLGSVITVNPNGSITLGDASKTSSTLGNLLITSKSPSISLAYAGSSNHGSGFRIQSNTVGTQLQVGAGAGMNNVATVVKLNGGVTSSNVELMYNGSKKLETTTTGIKVYDNLSTTSLTLNDILVYKSADGKFVIDGDIVVTGGYKRNWTGPGTGLPVGAENLVELNDVNIGSIALIEEPFVVGRKESSGNQVSYITKTDLITTLGVVTTPVFESHTGDSTMHVTPTDRLNWDGAAQLGSRLNNWDLIYSTYDTKEVGLSNTGESGAAISATNMKYVFYWDTPGGNKYALKTKFADNADALHNKPWDEFRFSRALGYSALPASQLLDRGLYDLGTVHAYNSDVPFDDSWQVETIDSSYLYNQSAPSSQKHKYQLANRWVAGDTSFDQWARGRDGSTQEWLPWVQMLHTGNTPVSIELYPVLPAEAYTELENEANWTYQFSTPGDEFELYIGETEGIDWAFNIGHRIINKQYIYEVTPIGIKRTGNVKFVVVMVSTTSLTTSFTISPIVDRYEVTMDVASNDIQIIVNHQREKPVVISFMNSTIHGASVYYTDPVLPNTKLLDLEPNVIIEVQPGVWQLN